MDLILATADGQEERVLEENLDLDIGKTNDFVLSASYGTWLGDIQIGKRIYIPGTEYGGIIKYIRSATNTGNIEVKGFTWRGYLDKRIIVPPAGSDYYIANGELNSVIRALVDIPGFVVPQINTGVTVNYRFGRYVTVAQGLQAMLQTVGYRLDIKYIQTQTGGYVQVQAVRAGNYGDSVEYSQDSMIDFASTDNQMGVNHLICLGKGELKDRLVIHLYTDKDGNISTTKTITGMDEIVATFENSGAESDTLTDTGKKRLKELRSNKSFTASIKDVEQELFLGDTVSGVDYITGNSVTKPIADKIVKRTSGVISIDYKIEGE